MLFAKKNAFFGKDPLLGVRLHLRSITQLCFVQLPNRGKRSYTRVVLKKRGRVVPQGGLDQQEALQEWIRHVPTFLHT